MADGMTTTARPEPDADGRIWFELPCCGRWLASMPREQWEAGEPVTRYCAEHGMTYDVIAIPEWSGEYVMIVIAPEGAWP